MHEHGDGAGRDPGEGTAAVKARELVRLLERDGWVKKIAGTRRTRTIYICRDRSRAEGKIQAWLERRGNTE